MSSFDSIPDPIYLPDHREDKDFAIEIPLDPDTLSSKLADIKECLRLEFAPIQIWHRIGVELYRNGLDSQCNSLLGLALEDDLEHISDWNTTVCSYEGNPEHHINLLNAATVQAINTINSINTSSHMSDNDYKLNIRKATQYYQLARNIATQYDPTEKYNMVLHFLYGLICIEKAKRKKEDILTIMVKTKHNLQKAISWKEMEEDEEDDDDDIHLNNQDNDPKKIPLQREPNFISLLCIATLAYATGDYEDSLTNFTKLLKMNLNNHNHNDNDNTHYLGFVHLGIGISSLKLREFDIARHAFERAKKIDKVRNNGKVGYVGIKSRIGLALVYLNQYDYTHNNNNNNNKKVNSMRKALKEITDAMLYSPNNPQLLVLIANFVGFSCENIEFTKMWAGTAYCLCEKITNLLRREPTERDIMGGLDIKPHHNLMSNNKHPLSKCESEACYVIGKMYHICLDYNEAVKWYYKSILLDSQFTLSLFGLAQMYIYFDKISHAKNCLVRIIKMNEDNNNVSDHVVLSHYAYVCRQCGDLDKAKDNLLRATQLNPTQVDLYIDLAEITEQKDASFAIGKYMRAKAIMNAQNMQIPFELFNNIIVLFYQLGDYEKAKRLCEELIAITNENNNEFEAHQIIIQYNYARILDKLSFYKKARKIYRQILINCPSFIEAILCNALYLYRSGKYMDAIRKFEDAARKAHEFGEINIELNAYLYIQRIYEYIGRRTECESILNKIEVLKKGSRKIEEIRNDEYSELISANYMLNHYKRSNSNYYRRLHDALQKYQQILVVNENNVYAVHGLAAIACEGSTHGSDNVGISQRILHKLSRECISCSDILCNLGHVHSVNQDWDLALKCYEKAKKKLMQNSHTYDLGDIPLYIVRTLFAKKDFVAAKLHLYQILRYNPTQELYLYNLALIEEEYACDILRKDPKKRTLKQIENVMKMLENAARLYRRLQINKKTHTQIPHDKLKQHLYHIENELLQNAKKHLQFQKNQQIKNEKKRLLEEKKLNKTLEKERKEIEKKKNLILKKEKENKLKAAQAKLKSKEINFIEPQQQLNKNRKRKRKNESEDEENIDNEPPVKRLKEEDHHHMDQFNQQRQQEEDDDYDILGNEEAETRKLRKKKKNKKKRKKKNKDKNKDKDRNKNHGLLGKIDETIWSKMEIKIEDIVQNADLNTLTNRQVKNKLAQYFPSINIKIYKKLIKEKINTVAQSKADQNE